MERTVQFTLRGDQRVSTDEISDLAREVGAFMAGQLGFTHCEVVIVGVRGRRPDQRFRATVEAEPAGP